MKKQPIQSTPRYTVVQREGPTHGGLYELEQTFFIDIVDTRSNTVLMTFESEGYATYQGNPGWGEFCCSGVEKVKISPDGKSALVYTYGSTSPKKIDLPQKT